MTKQLFPLPPSHYKSELKEPDISEIHQADTLSIFGRIINIKKINYFTSEELKSDEVKTQYENLAKASNTSNDIALLQRLINDLKRQFILFLKSIVENVDNCGSTLREIKSSIDVIQYIMYNLKRKQILIQTKNYLKNKVIEEEEKQDKEINNDINRVKQEMIEIINIAKKLKIK